MDDRKYTKDLINDLSAWKSPEIENTIQEVAKSVLGSTQPLTIQWDLLRCRVGMYWRSNPPKAFKVATKEHLESRREQEEWAGTETQRDAYALCIRIQLPTHILPEDVRVDHMKDILTRNTGSQFKRLNGIPFQNDTVYSMFNLEFTTDIEQKDLEQQYNRGANVWYRSPTIFLPVPSTVYDYCSTQYVAHNWEEKAIS
ncbi:hypothetical protein F4818DRAFT_443321 [Hypoxylon cercidicola]|nr:hypothetical protein F4818DRAFT_443321 [Hypoxylon cercidicola]